MKILNPIVRIIQVILITFQFSVRISAQEITVFDTQSSGMPDNTVRAIVTADDGAIWIGTDWGLARLKNGIWTNYNLSNAGLPDNSIRSLAIDKQNRVWVGTFFGGLAILMNDTVEIVYNSTNSPLPDDQVRSIAFDTAGVWIGTTGGLAYLRDTTWQVYNTSNSVLRSNNIATILIDNLDRVWMGTVNGGLVMKDDTIWNVYRNDNSGLIDNTVLDLALDSSNNIWMATPAGGLTAFNGSDWLNFNIVNSNSPTNSYNGVAVINDAKYLSAQANGLVIYRGGIVWENYDTANSSLPQDDLLSIAAGDSGCVWLGTLSSGLVKFCEQNSSVGVIAPDIEEITIFPVPVNSKLNIHFSNTYANIQANVYDLGGKRVVTQNSDYNDSMEIPLGGFANGFYLLELIFPDKTEVLKLVKAGGKQ